MATVVFVHGVGQTADAWREVIDALPPDARGEAVRLDLAADDFSLASAATRIRQHMDRRGIDRAHLCGLSLGAMIAVMIAAESPERVDRLILSGGQVRPNRALMTTQNALLRVLPARMASAPGLERADLLRVLRTVSTADLRPSLPLVRATTLVLCGGKDRPNLPAARELARGIPDAQLRIVPHVGHEWNVTHPAEFARQVADFVAS